MKSQTIFLAALALAVSLAAPAILADVSTTAPVPLDAFVEPTAECLGSPSLTTTDASADAIFLTGCTAQNDCTNHGGSSISCQGSGPSSCSVGLCSVTCNTQTTYCCDISGLACGASSACLYCACIAEGYFTPSECSDQACGGPDL